MQQSTVSQDQPGLAVDKPKAVVVIGASTGGPNALTHVIPKFPKGFPAALIVVQQMRPGFTRLLTGNLGSRSRLTVEEAEESDALIGGSAVFVPGDRGLNLSANGDENVVVCLEDLSSSIEGMKRRIDRSMISAASVFRSKAIGVLLTGLGDDGREGMKKIRDHGGYTIAQDEASSVVFDMPSGAINAGVVDEVLPLYSISERIIEIVESM